MKTAQIMISANFSEKKIKQKKVNLSKAILLHSSLVSPRTAHFPFPLFIQQLLPLIPP